jgi:hypothetical protein
MKLITIAALALLSSVFANDLEVVPRSLQGRRDCRSTPVPPCARRGNRDIIFLVDASDSMSPANFYGQMLDYVQTAFCAFDNADNNRAAMITFAREIVTRIPLAQYTAEQWFSAIDDVRADGSVCCSCCTPTAEAFRAARSMLLANPPVREDTLRVVLMISDGNPWQNTQGVFSTKRMGPSAYTYKAVPQQASLLKNLNGQKDSVRLLFLGAPDKWGNSADFGFFKGSNIPGSRRCVSDNLCRPVSDTPTKSPTRRPTTDSPTTAAPTHRPSTSPTESRRFDGLDLYLFLDRSRSMRWRYQDCRSAPGGSASWPEATACWQLFLGFAQVMAVKASQLQIRTPGSGGPGTKIRWQDDYTDRSKGLRVWIYGFACAES